MVSSLLKSLGKSIGAAGIKSTRSGARRLGTPLLMAGAVAAGVHASAPEQDPNSPNSPGFFNSLKEGLLDFAMGDPYADVTMAGFPMRLSDFMPIPHPIRNLQEAIPNISDNIPGIPDWAGIPDVSVPEPVRQLDRTFEHLNYMRQHGGLQDLMKRSQYMDREQGWYMNQARANVNRGYTTMNNELSSTLPYAPLTQRFGSYGSSGSSTGVQADGSMVFGMYNMRNG